MVLASSPTALVVLPPQDLQPGPAEVGISCAKRQSPAFSVTFVGLELEADSSPLKPGEHRALTVRVRGTTAKVTFEARNLAPEIAELTGGNPVRASSSGSAENLGKFEVVRSEEHTSELQSHSDLVCRLLLEKKKKHIREQRRWMSR